MFVLVGVFFFGMGIGGSDTTSQEIENVQNQIAQESEWKMLKETDDQGFMLAAEAMNYSSQMARVCSTQNVGEVDEISSNVEDLAPKIIEIAEKRQAILKRLGY